MDDTWRSSIRTLSMVFGMILAAFVVGAGPQGTPPLGPLVFSDVVTGGAMIVAVALATGAAVVAFRFGDGGGGLFAFGIVLWAAGRHLAPTVDRFFVPTTAGLLWDGLVLSAAIFGVSAVLTKVTGPACRPEPPDEGVPDRLAVGWLAMLVALPIAHLAAVSNDPGQAAGGAALGGVAAGLAGRLAAPHVSPYRLMLALVPIGVLGRAVVGPALVDAEAWRLGAGPGLLATLPMDWAGAGVAGFALGAVWARSFLKPARSGQNVASDAVSG